MLRPPHGVILQLLLFTVSPTWLWGAPNSRRRYTLHLAPLPFELAQEACRPHGLASLATPQELAQVLGVIGEAAPPGSPAIWLGLKKAKNRCVVPSLPLRGFKWTRGGEDATQTRWAHEPEQTCTSVLCAALVARSEGSAVTSWGLVPRSCKNKNPFICDLGWDDARLASPRPPGPETTGPESVAPEPAGPDHSEQKPEIAEPTTPGLAGAEAVRPESAGPEPAEPELSERTPALPEPQTPAETELSERTPELPEPQTPAETVSAGPGASEQKPKIAAPPTPEPAGPAFTRPELEEAEGKAEEPGPGTGPESGSGWCPRPVVAGARFLSLDHENSSRIRVDCWSKVRLDLHCWGRAGVWRLPGGAPANLSSVCAPCASGYRKDASGVCSDVDECSGPHGCRRRCVNTAGSFACVCAPDGTACEPTESRPPGPFSGPLVPALVGAALGLAVLLLVAGVTVWCCLRRRREKKGKAAERRDKLPT